MMSIKIYRAMRGWNQTELAAQAHITRATVSRIERGFPASRLAQIAICQALGVSPDEVTEFANISQGSGHDTKQ